MGQTIDLSEVFGIVGGTTSAIGGALSGSGTAAAAVPVAPPLDVGALAVGAGIGAGVALALDKSPAMGALGGAVLGYLYGASST